MAGSFQFTPVFVPTGEPISTAIASVGATIGTSFLKGSQSAKGGKAAARESDLVNQAGEVKSIGLRKLSEIQSLDPDAPEIPSYVEFVNQQIELSPGPGNEQGNVETEGNRIISLIRDRSSQRAEQANLASFAESLNRQFSDFSNAFSSALDERDRRLQNGITSGLNSLRSDVAQEFEVRSSQTSQSLNSGIQSLEGKFGQVQVEAREDLNKRLHELQIGSERDLNRVSQEAGRATALAAAQPVPQKIPVEFLMIFAGVALFLILRRR